MKITRRQIINLLLLTIFLYTLMIHFVYYDQWKIFSKAVQVNSSKGNPAQVFDDKSQIELTVRMSLHGNMVERLFCMFLRSAVIFWYPGLGDMVFILDEVDRSKKFEETLLTAKLPFSTRVVYEPDPSPKLEKVIKEYAISRKKTPGYVKMFYSSFFFDNYTSESAIIAWADLDMTFTMPVVMDSIFRNGKLIVKGLNQFDINWVKTWSHTTFLTLGFPMVSDFMTYFPTYVYATTIRNCREYITKKLGTNTFEEAFAIILGHMAYISPVNIIYTYAYYFERDRYHWNIDIGATSLEKYNKEFIKRDPLLLSDIKPELHVTVHTAYYKYTTDPLEQGICYTQLYLGMANIPHCEKFRNITNMQLFEFQSQATHIDTWCGGKKKRACEDIIEERYKTFVEVYNGNSEWRMNTSKIKVIHEVARRNFKVTCPSIRYVPFQSKKSARKQGFLRVFKKFW